MYTSIQCIVLRTVRYDDRRAIVSVWSRSHGRLSLMVPDGASREARRRRALMMPLGLFEGECDIRPGRDIHSVRDVRPLAVTPSICDDPVKSVVAIFLSEVLDRTLRDIEPDPHLSDFIFRSVEWLDKASGRGTANFPMLFLYRLGHFLGIEPDSGTWRKGCIFDLQGGVFRMSPPATGRWLDATEARGLYMIQRLDFTNTERFSPLREFRRRALDRILEYYSLHHTPLTTLRSLPILQEMF